MAATKKSGRRRRGDPGANALRGIIQAQVNNALRQEFQAAGLGGKGKRRRRKGAHRTKPRAAATSSSASPAPSPAPVAQQQQQQQDPVSLPSPPPPPPPKAKDDDDSAATKDDDDKKDDDKDSKTTKKDDDDKTKDADGKKKPVHHYKLIIGVLVLLIGGLFAFMYFSKDSGSDPVVINAGDGDGVSGAGGKGAKLDGGKNMFSGPAPTWLVGLGAAFGGLGSVAAIWRYRNKQWHEASTLSEHHETLKEAEKRMNELAGEFKEEELIADDDLKKVLDAANRSVQSIRKSVSKN